MLLGLVPPGGNLLGLRGELRVLAGELAGRADVVAELLPLPPRPHDGGHHGVPLVELLRQRLVGMGGRVRQLSLELGVLDDEPFDCLEHW
jgi:hypothetical protein